MSEPTAPETGPTGDRLAKLAAAVNQRQQGVVVIEDVTDPHNAEAVVRSCDAFGFQTVCLIFEREQPFDPKYIGKLSSAAANKWIDFRLYGSTTACLTDLKNDGYQLIATALSDHAESIYAIDFAQPRLAILLGNEHRGLTDTAMAMADRTLIIPMRGMTQSLNLSVTAAVTLYEITRQRLARGFDAYRLSATDRAALLDDFIYRRYPDPLPPEDFTLGDKPILR